MLLFYVRHGDPTYNPDQLTPLGERQAESVAKRLALFGIDKVYASPSKRAMQTAEPTCELLNIKKTLVPDFDEGRAFTESATYDENRDEKGLTWPWTHSELQGLFLSKEVRDLGNDWYTHEEIRKYGDYKKTADRIGGAIDRLLGDHGYHHDPESGTYTVDPEVLLKNEKGEERIAIFAHEGVGKFLLPHVLDIPVPLFSTHFEISHSSMTVIWIRTFQSGRTSARMLTLSNDSHLYRDGLPLDYRHTIRF